MPKPTIVAKATRAPEPSRPAPSALAQVWNAMTDIVRRIAALETRPAPQPVDLGPLNARIDAVYAALAGFRQPEDGKSVEEATVRLMVLDAVAALPKPPEVDAAAIVQQVRDAVAGDIDQVREMVAAMPAPESVPDVAAMVAEAIARIPRPEDGKSVEPAEVARMVSEEVSRVLATWARPEDGKSVTLADVEPLITDTVGKAVAALPKPVDGVSVVDAVVDGEGRLQVILSDARRVDAGKVVPAAEPGPSGRSLASARLTDKGNLVLTMSDGEEIDVGRAKGEDGDSIKGDPGRGIAALQRTGDDLIAVMSDGETVNLGRIKGQDGKPGKPGVGLKGDPGATMALINFAPANLSSDDLDSLYFADIELSDGTALRVITRN